MKKLHRCDHPECNRRSRVKRECVMCEKKGTKIHTIRACSHHVDWSLAAMKRHVLRKHPAVIPGLCFAALKGEDVF